MDINNQADKIHRQKIIEDGLKNTIFLLLCIVPSALVGSLMSLWPLIDYGVGDAAIFTYVSQFGVSQWIGFSLRSLVFTAMIWFIIVISLKSGGRVK